WGRRRPLRGCRLTSHRLRVSSSMTATARPPTAAVRATATQSGIGRDRRGLPQVVEDEIPCGIVKDDLAVLVLSDSGDPADTSPDIEVDLCDVLGVEPEPLFDLGEDPVLLRIRKRSEAIRVDGLEGHAVYRPAVTDQRAVGVVDDLGAFRARGEISAPAVYVLAVGPGDEVDPAGFEHEATAWTVGQIGAAFACGRDDAEFVAGFGESWDDVDLDGAVSAGHSVPPFRVRSGLALAL